MYFKKNNRYPIHSRAFAYTLAIFLLLSIGLITGCSDEKGPTVPAGTIVSDEITVQRDQEIRVGMLCTCPSPRIYFSITRGMMDIFLGEETAATYSGFAGQVWYAEAKDDKTLLLVDQNGKEHSIPQEKVTVRPAGDVIEDGHILFGDGKNTMRPFRGAFEIFVENDHILAVNIVKIEEYLLGVVPAEMPPSWPLDALKAQAVASRSYALFNLGRFGYRKFDIASTVISQAYAGVNAESEGTTQAVTETESEVLTYDGNLANCLYSSTCGGQSATAAEIFGLDIEVMYLKSNVDSSPWGDYCEKSPLYKWERDYSIDQLAGALRGSVHTDPGEMLSSLTIISRTQSDWMDSIYVSGTRDHVASASEFRSTLNKNLDPLALPSSNFEINFKDGQYHFSGKGFGHGVGMCQYGAKARGEENIHYDNILQHYYPGCEITEIPRANGLTFTRDENFLLLGERKRTKDEIEGLGWDYVPSEEELLDALEGSSVGAVPQGFEPDEQPEKTPTPPEIPPESTTA